MHGCTSFSHENTIIAVVAGGILEQTDYEDYYTNYNTTDSVEFLRVDDFSQGWYFGPKLPKSMHEFPMLTSPNGLNIMTIGGQEMKTREEVNSIYTMDCKMQIDQVTPILDTCKWVHLDGLWARTGPVALWLPENIDISCD